MNTNSITLANYILLRSSKRLSNLELQKILYFICRDYRVKYNENLIAEKFVKKSRLMYILESVYAEFRFYGANDVDLPIQKIELSLSRDKTEYINGLIDKYSNIHYWDLVEMMEIDFKKE